MQKASKVIKRVFEVFKDLTWVFSLLRLSEFSAVHARSIQSRKWSCVGFGIKG